MRYIKGLMFVALMAFSSAFFIESPNLISIEKVEAACGPGNYSDGGQTCSPTNTVNADKAMKNTLVADFADYYSLIAGVLLAIAIATIVYAGYQLVTSAGAPDKTFRAKRTLFGAGAGIVIILSGFTIMRLFLSFLG